LQLFEPGGRIYQQTFVDTCAKLGFAKLYDRKTPLTSADLLNDRVIPFYDGTAFPCSACSPTIVKTPLPECDPRHNHPMVTYALILFYKWTAMQGKNGGWHLERRCREI
jgi:hypothetical protein